MVTNAFKAFECFSNLPDDVLDALARCGSSRTFRKKSVLMQEGDKAEAVFFLVSGKVKLAKMNPEGQEKLLTIVRSGEMFGEISAFDGGMSPYQAEALEKVTVITVPLSQFVQLVETHPALALACIRIEAKRLRQAYRHMKNLALLDTHGRIAARLFKLCRDFGRQEGESIRIGLNLTRQEMAQLIGTSRETVSRVLAEYERMGIIEVDRHQIIVHDIEELRSRATGAKE